MKPAASVTIRLLLPAPVDRVLETMSNPRLVKQWSGQRGKIELKVGGRLELFDGWVRGRVTEYKPPTRLVHTWIPEDWPNGTPPSVVAYRFVGTNDGGTRVVLSHKRLPNEREAASHKSGWREYFFDPLKEFLESHR
jgi:uncharacterized protein YndB with AHSA1/START domain